MKFNDAPLNNGIFSLDYFAGARLRGPSFRDTGLWTLRLVETSLPGAGFRVAVLTEHYSTKARIASAYFTTSLHETASRTHNLLNL